MTPHDPIDGLLKPTGVSEVDEQHTAILDSLDGILEQDTVDLADLAALKRLLQEHFDEEEALMRQILSLDYADHCEKHRHFIQYIATLEARAGESGPLPSGDVHLLRAWFVSHSNVHDLDIADDMNRLGRSQQVRDLGLWLEALKAPS
ncbi:hemerythrin-like metal-binding protein [Azospirillum fermentarium]|uniref:bacteriohemerythrin n=1 Tax=Azospirillum fermentarium TaxID=1233114 RepID=UPI00222667BE|nr:hemerythrin family protein [Azospirillum fermentarium]MCW2247246.1 hemerythrin-like metal-binding protein [Azospirillum fermentarium]